MKNLTRQNPRQLIVAQELINKVKSKCCGIKVLLNLQQVFEEMQYSQGLHGTDETTKRTEK